MVVERGMLRQLVSLATRRLLLRVAGIVARRHTIQRAVSYVKAPVLSLSFYDGHSGAR